MFVILTSGCGPLPDECAGGSCVHPGIATDQGTNACFLVTVDQDMQGRFIAVLSDGREFREFSRYAQEIPQIVVDQQRRGAMIQLAFGPHLSSQFSGYSNANGSVYGRSCVMGYGNNYGNGYGYGNGGGYGSSGNGNNNNNEGDFSFGFGYSEEDGFSFGFGYNSGGDSNGSGNSNDNNYILLFGVGQGHVGGCVGKDVVGVELRLYSLAGLMFDLQIANYSDNGGSACLGAVETSQQFTNTCSCEHDRYDRVQSALYETADKAHMRSSGARFLADSVTPIVIGLLTQPR